MRVIGVSKALVVMRRLSEKCCVAPFAVGVALEVAYLSLFAIYRSGFPDATVLMWYVGISLACGALWMTLSLHWRPGRISTATIFFFAVVFRLTMIGAPPTTSGDVFRYVWDGKVFAHGVNPYRFAPKSEALIDMRTPAIHPHINHPDVPTIYPPLAQVAFAISYLLGGDSLFGIKTLALLADFATLALLWMFLRRTKLADPSWIVVYAWCPLPILEFMTAGHMDVLGLPFLTLFYWALHEKRAVAGALALAAATLMKVFPVLLLPFLLRRVDEKRRPLAFAVFMLVAVAGWSGFFLDGVDPFSSLKIYAWNWRFNSPVFSFLEAVLEDGWRARRMCLVFFLLVAGGLTFFGRRLMETVQSMWMTFFLLNTTVFPWYLTWMTPGLVVARSFPILWLTATAPLTYVTELGRRTNGDWKESCLVWATEFAPIAIWLAQRGVTDGLRVWRRGVPSKFNDGDGAEKPGVHDVRESGVR